MVVVSEEIAADGKRGWGTYDPRGDVSEELDAIVKATTRLPGSKRNVGMRRRQHRPHELTIIRFPVYPPDELPTVLHVLRGPRTSGS